MTPQERDLITTLLQRLKDTTRSGQPKDPEADALIRQMMREQPDAPYYLVQTVLIQDLSLHQAQNRIADLEQQLEENSQRPSGSFLGGLFGSREPSPPPVQSAGPWGRGPQVAPPPPQASGGYGRQDPQAGYPQQGNPQQGNPQQGGMMGGGMMGGGGGFLRSAAATAAGVAGGALLFQGISSMFGSGYANSLGASMNPGLGESVSNNYSDGTGGDYGGGGDAGYSGGGDYSAGGDYGGGDYGGGGDDYGGDDFGGGGDISC